MNKKLLAAAVGAAMGIAPMIAAQAATTLYGHMHLSWDRFDADTAERSFISSNSTRFGIKGDEDFGGGLKGIYQIETGGIGVDEATTGLGGDLRNSFLGFSNSSWGTIKIGRHDTPYKDLGRRLDQFNEQIGDSRAINSLAGTFDVRAKNMVRYESPTFGGLNVNVLQSSNNGDETTTSVQRVTSVGANWTAGPLFVGAAMEEHSFTPAGAGTKDKETGTRLAATYTLGAFTIGASYDMFGDVGGVADVDNDVMGLYASFKMGNNLLKAHWLQSELDCPSTMVCTGTDSTLMAIGVNHNLSKTATAYINYATMDNDANIYVPLAGSYTGHGENLNPTGGATAQVGKDPSAISVGFIFKF